MSDDEQHHSDDNLIGDPNDLDDLIEGEAQDDQPDEANEGGGEEEGAEDQDENADGAEGRVVEPKKKKVVRNPQPKLDPLRLCGPRGIATLEEVFTDFKFHGKGYEKQDLNRIMKRLGHWAHRLFPRFRFDDCLDKIEKLGTKRQVQTYVTKIRLGMISVQDEFVQDVARIGDANNDNDDDNGAIGSPPRDAFDDLLDHDVEFRHSQRENNVPQDAIPTSSSVVITDDQRERMMRNRLLAEERRLARLKAQQEKRLMCSEQSVASAESGSSTENKENIPVAVEEVSNEEQVAPESGTGSQCAHSSNGERRQSREFASSSAVDIPSSAPLVESDHSEINGDNELTYNSKSSKELNSKIIRTIAVDNESDSDDEGRLMIDLESSKGTPVKNSDRSSDGGKDLQNNTENSPTVNSENYPPIPFVNDRECQNEKENRLIIDSENSQEKLKTSVVEDSHSDNCQENELTINFESPKQTNSEDVQAEYRNSEKDEETKHGSECSKALNSENVSAIQNLADCNNDEISGKD